MQLQRAFSVIIQERKYSVKGTLMFILLLCFGVGLLAIAVFILWYSALINKHGLPELPDEIAAVDSSMKDGGVAVDISTYRFGEERQERKTYLKSFESDSGHWDVTIEMDGEKAIAYQALLKHNKTRLLNSVREGWAVDPKIIRIIGCG